jgi:hypothetical protein
MAPPVLLLEVEDRELGVVLGQTESANKHHPLPHRKGKTGLLSQRLNPNHFKQVQFGNGGRRQFSR